MDRAEPVFSVYLSSDSSLGVPAPPDQPHLDPQRVQVSLAFRMGVVQLQVEVSPPTHSGVPLSQRNPLLSHWEFSDTHTHHRSQTRHLGRNLREQSAHQKWMEHPCLRSVMVLIPTLLHQKVLDKRVDNL
jgi:hypothetical protein